jgi:maleate cis-trans isomerase
MTGSPLRIGLLVPANNTTMAPELRQWLPAGSTCNRVGIPRGKGTLTAGDLPSYLGQAVKLAKKFSGEEIDEVVYGCTAAGFLAGPAREAELAAELGQVTGKRVVTTAQAMIAALRHANARRISVVTPYLNAVNAQLRACLADAGIEVVVLASFRARTTAELAAITPAQIAALARAAMRPASDALFIGCSQLPTYAISADLEREFGRPVWSSIRATAWQAQQHAKDPHLEESA